MATKINLKDAVLVIKDGTGTPLTLTAVLGAGNLSYTEARNLEYVLNRGNLDDVTEGDDIPLAVSLSFTWTEIVGDSALTIEDALKRTGSAAAWVSTDADLCRPYAVDLEITHTPPVCTTKKKEVILLSDFRWDTFEHDYESAMVSVTGRCNVTEATRTRVAQS